VKGDCPTLPRHYQFLALIASPSQKPKRGKGKEEKKGEEDEEGEGTRYERYRLKNDFYLQLHSLLLAMPEKDGGNRGRGKKKKVKGKEKRRSRSHHRGPVRGVCQSLRRCAYVAGRARKKRKKEGIKRKETKGGTVDASSEERD